MRRRRAAGFRRVCVQCSAEFRSPTHNAQYCSGCTSNRNGTCGDCGRGFLYHCRGGRIPSRCKACSASHARKAKREYWQKNPRYRKAGSPKVGQCMKCGVAVCSRGPSGRAPSTCVPCKKAKNREKARSALYDIECRECHNVFVSVGSPSRKLCDHCLSVHRKAEMMTCVICGKTRNRWASGGNSAGVCCSKKCAAVMLSRRAKERARSRGDGLRSLLGYVKVLIEKEQKNRLRALKSLLVLCERLVANENRCCIQCARPLNDPDGRDRLCSDECKALRQRSQKKIRRKPGNRKHGKRAALRGLPRSYSKEMLIQAVGDRCGWVCQLCCQVIEDSKLREGPLAPCIDHIVPINHKANTRHGHTPENVQIAHRSCNEAKGCSIACISLIECDNPSEWVKIACIDQTPQVGVWEGVFSDPRPHGPSTRISGEF
jgi:hypothetical protein